MFFSTVWERSKNLKGWESTRHYYVEIETSDFELKWSSPVKYFYPKLSTLTKSCNFNWKSIHYPPHYKSNGPSHRPQPSLRSHFRCERERNSFAVVRERRRYVSRWFLIWKCEKVLLLGLRQYKNNDLFLFFLG